MDCNEVLDGLGEYIDKEARKELCAAIEAHLAQCRNCRIEFDSVRMMLVLYHEDRRIQTPVAISSRLEAALAREYARAADVTAD